MPLLPVSGYSVAQLVKALHRSPREVSYRFDVLDERNVYQRAATNVSGGSLQNNALSDIKRGGTFQISEDDNIDWPRERIMPFFRLRMPNGGWAEWPLGVFLLATPKRSVRSVRTIRSVEAYDQLLVLADDRIEDRYVVSKDSSYTDAVRLFLQDTPGLGRIIITNSNAILPVDREWEPNTTRLRIVNDLLGAINYNSLYFDAMGVGRVTPYQEPGGRPIDYRYLADSNSLISPEAESDLDMFDVPNRFIGVVSEPDRPPLRSVYVNENPESPTSTVRRGRIIVEVMEDMEAADQEALDSLVRRAALRRAQIYEGLSISTAVMPFHGNLDVLEVNYDRIGEAGRYIETSWSFDLEPGSLMKHDMRRMVEV